MDKSIDTLLIRLSSLNVEIELEKCQNDSPAVTNSDIRIVGKSLILLSPAVTDGDVRIDGKNKSTIPC